MKTLADLTAPAQVERKLLEKDVQKQCVDWARKRGYLARKFSSQSQRSVPDYLMFSTQGHFWVEFKRSGCSSTEAQRDEQALLLQAGLPGFECSDFGKFKEWVGEFEHARTDD